VSKCGGTSESRDENRRMCRIALRLKTDFQGKELRERERLGIGDITSVLWQNRLRWYGNVLQKDYDWMYGV